MYRKVAVRGTGNRYDWMRDRLTFVMRRWQLAERFFDTSLDKRGACLATTALVVADLDQ